MMKFAVGFGAPIALRYPRGEAYDGLAAFRAPIEYGRSEMIYEEKDIAVLAVGSMVKTAEKVYAQLKLEGRFCTLVNARFVKPVDEDMIRKLVHTHKLLVTMEENVESGGFGERVRTFADDNGLPVRILSIAVPDEYVEHGNVDLLKQEIGIDSDSILKRIHEVLGEV
ncbi:MAG: transketolase C-terminal domain-containing protein [Eisenbergiella sp.]